MRSREEGFGSSTPVAKSIKQRISDNKNTLNLSLSCFLIVYFSFGPNKASLCFYFRPFLTTMTNIVKN